MDMNTIDLINELEQTFPLFIQEKYDNAGVQVLFKDEIISSILISLDLDKYIIEEAVEKKCNFIITHHPVFFKPIKNILSTEPKSELLINLINNKISVYSIHTNLDKIYYYVLGNKLNLDNLNLLIHSDKINDNDPMGYGVKSILDKPISLEELNIRVKKKLNLNFLIYCGDLKRKIRNIAAINGAGGGLIEKIIIENSIDCIITGDVSYHNIKFAMDNNVCVIDAGHFGTEKVLLDFLRHHIQEFLTNKYHDTDTILYISEKEENPFKIY